MPRHTETRALPYSREQMFDLVADVKSYPQFLPWVMGTRVRSNDGRVMLADMIVGFKMVRETFTSRVNLDRPARIHVDYISGPLKHLHNDWVFRSSSGGCDIDFCVDFEFRSRLFESLAGAFFHEAFKRMVAAFEKRAAQIYGVGDASGISNSSATRTA